MTNHNFKDIIELKEETALNSLNRSSDENLIAFTGACKRLIEGLHATGTDALDAAGVEAIVDEIVDQFDFKKEGIDIHLDPRNTKRLESIELLLRAILKQKFPGETPDSWRKNTLSKVHGVLMGNTLGKRAKHATSFGMNSNRKKITKVLDQVIDSNTKNVTLKNTLSRRRFLQGAIGTATALGVYSLLSGDGSEEGNEEKVTGEAEASEVLKPTFTVEVVDGRTVKVNIQLPEDTDLVLNKTVVFQMDVPGAKGMKKYSVDPGGKEIRLNDTILPKGGELVCALTIKDSKPEFIRVHIDAI